MEILIESHNRHWKESGEVRQLGQIYMPSTIIISLASHLLHKKSDVIVMDKTIVGAEKVGGSWVV